MSLKALLVSLVVGLFVLTGCGDPDADGRDGGSSGQRTAMSSETGDDPTAELRQLLTDFTSRTYTATYAIDSTDPSEPDTGIEMDFTVTQVQKGPEYTRQTITMFGEGATYSISVIATPQIQALCSEEAGAFIFLVLMTDHTCIDLAEQPGDAELAPQLFNPARAIQEADFTVVSVSAREIGEESAACYEVRSDAPTSGLDEDEGEDPENALLCWSGDGRLVSLGGVATSAGTRTLIEFSDNVAGDAFDAPYPLTQRETLEVRNETDLPISVHGQNDNSGFNNGSIEIDPHSSGTFRGGFQGPIDGISLSRTQSLPQWFWGCTWDDAKAHEPLIVKDESANCTDTSDQ